MISINFSNKLLDMAHCIKIEHGVGHQSAIGFGVCCKNIHLYHCHASPKLLQNFRYVPSPDLIQQKRSKSRFETTKHDMSRFDASYFFSWQRRRPPPRLSLLDFWLDFLASNISLPPLRAVDMTTWSWNCWDDYYYCCCCFGFQRYQVFLNIL